MRSLRCWVVFGAVVVAVGCLVAGGVGLIRADRQVSTRFVTIDGVPMLVASPKAVFTEQATGGPSAIRAPGVVVAHGFAASARLMRGFADTLASRGYVVVVPDLTGHGANPARLTTEGEDAFTELQHDLDTAVA